MQKEIIRKHIEDLEMKLHAEDTDKESITQEISSLKKELKELEYEIEFGL